PVGGREDFAALFHEGGHTEHYANTEAALPLAHRQLGDNAVTESFAFLIEHLTEDPEWLRSRLAIVDHGPVVRHARAVKLVMLRRYAAKIAYEVELLGPGADLAAMPQRYAELLGGATRVRWPRQSWLADVDGGFYVACYLRAWALELGWRGALRERFGERWFEHPESGDWLRGLWSQGQRLDAEELLSQTLGSELDFGALADELVGG
ncbi:MAG: peptidase M3, partial [Solirubrobacterales bacterium]